MSQVKSCHYITRCVTKAWEAKDRRLHFFDLKTETIGAEPSRTLFAIDNLHTTETERTLSRRVEDAVGKFLSRCKKAGQLVDFNDDPRAAGALLALIVLQLQRTHEALAAEKPKVTLDQLLGDERALDALLAGFALDHDLIGAMIPPDEWMCFPSVGFFTIPIIGDRPAFAMPLTPGIFVAAVPRGARMESVTNLIRTPRYIQVFSTLGGGLEHKLVIPASIAEQNEPEALISLLKGGRVHGRKIVNLIGKASIAIGSRAWGYSE